jgi:hypothetical protein
MRDIPPGRMTVQARQNAAHHAPPLIEAWGYDAPGTPADALRGKHVYNPFKAGASTVGAYRISVASA